MLYAPCHLHSYTAPVHIWINRNHLYLGAPTQIELMQSSFDNVEHEFMQMPI